MDPHFSAFWILLLSFFSISLSVSVSLFYRSHFPTPSILFWFLHDRTTLKYIYYYDAEVLDFIMNSFESDLQTLNCKKPCIKRARIRSSSGPHSSHIFPHSDWIRRDTEYFSVFSWMRENAGKMRTRITPNTDSFHAVYCFILRLTELSLIQWEMWETCSLRPTTE